MNKKIKLELTKEEWDEILGTFIAMIKVTDKMLEELNKETEKEAEDQA